MKGILEYRQLCFCPALIVCLIVLLALVSCKNISTYEMPGPGIVNNVKLIKTKKIHSTTRGTVRRVLRYNDMWFVVFESNKYMYSHDGIQWHGPINDEKVGLSLFMVDDYIYSISNKDEDPHPKVWALNHYISKGKITNSQFVWEDSSRITTVDNVKHSNELNELYFYYPDLQIESNGKLSFTIIRMLGKSEREASFSVMKVMSKNFDDIAHWEEPQKALHQEGETETPNEHVTLDDGRSFVFAKVSKGNKFQLLGNFFNGTSWSKSDIFFSDMSASPGGGDDKRMSAILDPEAKILHLLYIDKQNRLIYRNLATDFISEPHTVSDWSGPVVLEKDVFTVTQGIDKTKNPAHLWMVYGKIKFQSKKDARGVTGDLLLRKYNGLKWEDEKILISEPGTIYNWYPNINEDVSSHIGVLYLKNKGTSKTFDIRFASVRTDSMTESKLQE